MKPLCRPRAIRIWEISHFQDTVNVCHVGTWACTYIDGGVSVIATVISAQCSAYHELLVSAAFSSSLCVSRTARILNATPAALTSKERMESHLQSPQRRLTTTIPGTVAILKIQKLVSTIARCVICCCRPSWTSSVEKPKEWLKLQALCFLRHSVQN